MVKVIVIFRHYLIVPIDKVVGFKHRSNSILIGEENVNISILNLNNPENVITQNENVVRLMTVKRGVDLVLSRLSKETILINVVDTNCINVWVT